MVRTAFWGFAGLACADTSQFLRLATQDDQKDASGKEREMQPFAFKGAQKVTLKVTSKVTLKVPEKSGRQSYGKPKGTLNGTF